MNIIRMTILRAYARIVPAIVLALLIVITTIPVQVLAASSSARPSCSLAVTTAAGSTTLNSGTVAIAQNDTLTVAWTSLNATRGTLNGKSIALNGSATSTSDSQSSYSFSFSDGHHTAKCSLKVEAQDATIDTASLAVKSGEKADLTGTADGAKTIDITVAAATGTKETVYSKNSIKVKNGDWEAALNKTLPDGTYTVTVTGDRKAQLNVLAVGTLAVGQPVANLKVAFIPLLTGGTAHAGQTVPISYLQLTNQSSTSIPVAGFWVKQDGSAPDLAVIGLTTVDDKGGSRGAVGGAEGVTPFSNHLAFVPVTGVILTPGQTKLFTVKAQLSSKAAAFTGSTLMLDIANVDAQANLKATFPIKGVTWAVAP